MLILLHLTNTAGLVAPFHFKTAVDKLMIESAGVAAAEACLMGVLWYGGTRMLSQVTKELQYPLFAPVGQVCHWFASKSVNWCSFWDFVFCEIQ